MPIKQIERRIEQHATSGYIALGTIHKGGPKKNEQYGDDLDYFRVAFFPQFEIYEPVFRRLYGAQPKVFDPVLILGNSPQIAFENWRIGRDLKGERINRRCDGEQQQMWYDERGVKHDARYEPIEPLACLGAKEKDGKCKVCGYNGKLYLIFPEFYQATKRYGYFILNTGSQADIAHISAALERWFPIAQLETMAFCLRREEQHDGWRSYPKKDGSGIGTTEVRKNLIVLEPSELSAPKIAAYLSAQTSALPELSSGKSSLLMGNGETGVNRQAAEPADTVDGLNRPAEPDADPDIVAGDFTEEHAGRSVFVQFENGEYSYVVRCDGAQNFWFADDLVFREIDYDTSKWQAKGKVIQFNPPLIVTARGDEVISVRRGE